MLVRTISIPVDQYETSQGVLHVTQQRARNWVDGFRRMTQSGLTVPVHVLDPKQPRRMGASITEGSVTDMRLGYQDRSVDITYAIKTPSAILKLSGSELHIEPMVSSYFKDGRGREYQDVLSSLTVWKASA